MSQFNEPLGNSIGRRYFRQLLPISDATGAISEL